MRSSDDRRAVPERALPWLLGLYCAASLLHFVHNAENLADYPNLPAAITRTLVYATWGGVFLLGVAGFILFRRGHPTLGLALLAVYTGLGLDGLLHYGRASLNAHTLGMNVTIWFEVVAAAMALVTVAWIFIARSRTTSAAGRP